MLVALLGAVCAGCRTDLGASDAAARRASPPVTSIAAAPAATGAAAWTTPRVVDVPAGAVEEPRDMEGKGPWVLTATASSRWAWGGDLHTQEPGIDTWTTGLRLFVTKPCIYCAKFSFYGGYKHRRDFFAGDDALRAGTARPWKGVHLLDLGVSYFQPLSETWGAYLACDVGAAAEQGAALDDGFTLAGTFGLGHRVSPTLDVGAGVVVLSRFAEDVRVFGGPQFTWKMSDIWKLQLEGAKLELSHQPSKTVTIGLSGAFESNRFRLRSSAPGFARIVTDSWLPVALSVRLRSGDDMRLDLRAGVDLYRSLVIEDREGDALRSFDADPALFLGLSWTVKF